MRYIDADLLNKEMEKRMHICDGVFERDSDTYYQGKAVAYQETLSFIDSLQQEQPCEELEKYASRAGFDYVDDIEIKYPGHRWNDHDVEFAYRDGIIAGAEWKEEQDDKETADLLAIAHLQGMEQQKKEMMKEVTECELVCFKDHLLAVLPMKEFRWTAGDKVKIVIVKEDKI